MCQPQIHLGWDSNSIWGGFKWIRWSIKVLLLQLIVLINVGRETANALLTNGVTSTTYRAVIGRASPCCGPVPTTFFSCSICHGGRFGFITMKVNATYFVAALSFQVIGTGCTKPEKMMQCIWVSYLNLYVRQIKQDLTRITSWRKANKPHPQCRVTRALFLGRRDVTW